MTKIAEPRSARDATLRVERAGRIALEHRLIAAGYQVAVPVYDAGIDLIVFSEEPFMAWPVQLKAAASDPVSVQKKYDSRDMYIAYVHHALSDAPAVFVMPYGEAVRIIAEPHAQTASWKDEGVWRYPTLTARLREEIEPYSKPGNWFKGVVPADA